MPTPAQKPLTTPGPPPHFEQSYPFVASPTFSAAQNLLSILVSVRALASVGSVGKSNCRSRMGSTVVDVVLHLEHVTEDDKAPENV